MLLSNAYLIAKIGFGTAENEPAKKLQNIATTNNLHAHARMLPYRPVSARVWRAPEARWLRRAPKKPGLPTRGWIGAVAPRPPGRAANSPASGAAPEKTKRRKLHSNGLFPCPITR